MDIYERIVALRHEGRRAALATIIGVRGSIPSYQTAKMIVCEDGTIFGTVGGGVVEGEVVHAALQVIAEEKPRTLEFDLSDDPQADAGPVCGGKLEIFVEPLLSPPLLYVFGAGDVGFQVYRIARIAGFEVTVWDDREDYANGERFPDAREVVAAGFDELSKRLALREPDLAVIVTRGHDLDLQVLRWALTTPARYIGMIGSRRKVAGLFQTLESEGVPLEKLDRVYAPIGLDIGALSPEEIAISIVAELISCWRHASAALPHLRFRNTALKT
jgi:xanthine dehydrogenase accessory factor